ncbi:HNH endonuclease [Agrobacterium sp. NPDC058088]|uniref:HNH endonuclease n=1 Tax=Agrobacterium sp. NPDC058088 TaxID=3346335 RepID=UPI0036DE3D89
MTSANFTCILCKEASSGDTKPEHILLNALGGRMTVRTVLCPACNHTMGIGPDNDLADSISFIRNVCQLVAGDGDSPPSVLGLQTEGQRFDLLPGMDVRMRPEKPLQITIDDDSITVQIGAYSDAQADKLAEGAARSIAKKLGKNTPEAITAIKADILKERRSSIVPAPSVSKRLAFGTGRSQQAMAKACLVLLAKRLGNSEILHTRYDEARAFVFSAAEEETGSPLVAVDTRSFPPLEPEFGSNPNVVWVGTDAYGAAFGYYRLYGAIGWKFKLCNVGAPPSIFACLVSNPFDNARWRYYDAGPSPLPLEWVLEKWDAWPPNYEAVTSALTPLMELAHSQSQRNSSTQWIKEALTAAGLREGDMVTEEHVQAITAYVTPRILATMLQKPVPIDD